MSFYNSHIVSVILVTAGSGATMSVEVLFANGTSYCTLPDLPDRYIYSHTQDGLTACGSGSSGNWDQCITLTDGHWLKSHTLLYIRGSHTSWALGDGRVVLMGGNGGLNSRITSEILSPGSSTTSEGFPMKNQLE